MAKLPLFLLVLMIVVGYSLFIFLRNPNTEFKYRPGSWPEADAAINQATYLYKLKTEQGANLSKGPCLSNAVQPGWVADLVHEPRLPIDDQPANQCSAYLEGGAKNIVELDLEGNLVRVK